MAVLGYVESAVLALRQLAALTSWGLALQSLGLLRILDKR